MLLDAGVWIAAGTPAHAEHKAAGQLIRKPPLPLAAIDLTFYEIANVVGARDHQPDAARALAKVLRRRCAERIVTLGQDLFEFTLELAAQYELTAYDAAYVAAARQNGWQLVSLDIRDLVSKGLAVTPEAALYS
jgi:predicted nucleic acid-binding protein